MNKRAIVYTSDIFSSNSDAVIDGEFEKKRIEQYAKANDITVVAWFEEAAHGGTLFTRPKLKELVAYKEPYDLVLIERAGALSGKWREIRGMMKLFDGKNARLECTTTLYDCISMMARNYYRHDGQRAAMSACARSGSGKSPAHINLVETYGRTGRDTDDRYVNVVIRPAREKVAVRRPARLAFDWARRSVV
jgi:hypothetical protein